MTPCILARIERKHKELDKSEGIFKPEIKHFRNSLKHWLVSLEETSLDDLKYSSGQACRILKEHEQTVANLLQCLNETKQLLNK